jgi:carbonic anhydrase
MLILLTILSLYYRKEALRSIVISQRLLGTHEVAVYHHTDCGMLTFTNEQIRQKVNSETPDVADIVDKIDFLPFPHLEQSVKDDVKFLTENSLLLPGTTVTGWVYDVKSGKVRQSRRIVHTHSLIATIVPSGFESRLNAG